MKHLEIDEKKCIGCGLCKQVCIRDNIEIEEIAVELGNDCFDCGQCSTLCPTNAIELVAYAGQADRIENYDMANIPVSYENMLQFYKQRRTVRWFKDEKISKETFLKLMEAAYYSPNRQNIQDVEFVVVDEKLDDFIELVYDIISVKEDEFFRIKQLGNYLRDENRNPKRHPLLWEGSQLILAFSESKTDAVIAMTRLELLAYTLGLGGFHSLFIGMAEETNHEKLMEFFPEINSNKHMYAAFVIGVPRVKYLRTRPHHQINLLFK
jgi:ferredoxin